MIRSTEIIFFSLKFAFKSFWLEIKLYPWLRKILVYCTAFVRTCTTLVFTKINYDMFSAKNDVFSENNLFKGGIKEVSCYLRYMKTNYLFNNLLYKVFMPITVISKLFKLINLWRPEQKSAHFKLFLFKKNNNFVNQ